MIYVCFRLPSELKKNTKSLSKKKKKNTKSLPSVSRHGKNGFAFHFASYVESSHWLTDKTFLVSELYTPLLHSRMKTEVTQT